MAAFPSGTATTPTNSGFVRVYILDSGSNATASSIAWPGDTASLRYRDNAPYERLDRAIAQFAKLALTAYERKLRASQLATARQAEELRRSRLHKVPRPHLPPRRVARCCSLAASWRVSH